MDEVRPVIIPTPQKTVSDRSNQRAHTLIARQQQQTITNSVLLPMVEEGLVPCIFTGHYFRFTLRATSCKAPEGSVELVVKIDNSIRHILAPFTLRYMNLTHRALDLLHRQSPRRGHHFCHIPIHNISNGVHQSILIILLTFGSNRSSTDPGNDLSIGLAEHRNRSSTVPSSKISRLEVKKRQKQKQRNPSWVTKQYE
jgi:hypothetical protein